MATNLVASGPYVFDGQGGAQTQTSFGTYSFCSAELTTTDSPEDNILSFGVGLSELVIQNTGSNPLAFQFPEFYLNATSPPQPARRTSGIVLPGDKVVFRRANKRGVKVFSLTTGSSTKCYVFGI
jgi:hypothetical protein